VTVIRSEQARKMSNVLSRLSLSIVRCTYVHELVGRRFVTESILPVIVSLIARQNNDWGRVASIRTTALTRRVN